MVYSQEETMLIGALAMESGVSKDAIRLYERKGLITSSSSPAGSRVYRRYRSDSIEMIKKIKLAQSAGLKLVEIKEIFGAWDKTDTAGRHRLLRERIVLIDRQIGHLQAFRKALTAKDKTL